MPAAPSRQPRLARTRGKPLAWRRGRTHAGGGAERHPDLRVLRAGRSPPWALTPGFLCREVLPVLNVEARPHRPFLRASAGGQKLFLMLKLLPAPEAANARPTMSLAVVVDTSGSMREPAPGTTPELVPTDPVTVDGKM